MPDGSLISGNSAILPDAREALDEVNRAFTNSQPFRSTWETARQLYLPDAAPFSFANQTPGQRDRSTIVDTYPQYALRTYATFQFGAVIDGDGQWFKCVPYGHKGADDPDVVAWADEYRRRLSEFLMDPSTGFVDEFFTMLKERGAFGNGRVFCGDRPGALPIFRCTGLRDSAWLAAGDHEPSSHFWRQTLKAREWAKKFPGKDLGPVITRALETPAGRNTDFTFAHCLIQNPGWSPREADEQPTKRRYLSYWINEAEVKIVSASWLTSDPYHAFRAPRRANEDYGRGPGEEALEEGLMTQRIRIATIRGLEKSVDPLMLLPDDGVLTPPTNEPAGAMVVRADMMMRSGDPVRYMHSEARPDVGEQFLRDSCYASIDRAFSRDLMTLPQEPRMLDSQIIGRQEEQSRGIVPMIAPLFAPTARLIGRFADILQRQGKLPRPPAAAHGLQLAIQFRNPLEKASRLAEVRAFMQVLSLLASASQVDPGARHAIKVIEGVQWCARVLGLPEKFIVPADQLQRLLKADNDAAMQQRQMETAKDATVALKNAGQGAQGFLQPKELQAAA